MRRRLLGLALSGIFHALVILALLSLVRFTAEPDYAGYYDTLRRRLYESLTYPTMARRRSLSGTVVVDVEIDASGKVGRVTLVNSSSHAPLDEAALDAVRAVSRVPFPSGVPPRRLLVRLPVVFEIR